MSEESAHHKHAGHGHGGHKHAERKHDEPGEDEVKREELEDAERKHASHARDEGEPDEEDEGALRVEQLDDDDDTLTAAIAYLLMPVTGFLLYLIEKEDRFVRFHAAQSTIAGIILVVIWVGFGILAVGLAFIPIVGWIIGILLALGLMAACFVFWVFLMYKAYSGDKFKIPFIGDLAEKKI